MLPTTMSAVAVGIVIPWLPGGGTVARAGADVRARQIRLSARTPTRTSRADCAPPIDAEFSLSTGHDPLSYSGHPTTTVDDPEQGVKVLFSSRAPRAPRRSRPSASSVPLARR